MIDHLKLSPIKYDKERNYLHNLDDEINNQIKENIKDLFSYCAKLRPYMAFYKMQIKACSKTTHHILKNGVDLTLPKFPKGQKSKRGIFSAIISGFVGLAFKGILNFLHNRKHKALHKAVKAMSIQTDIQRNKLMHLENTLVIYGVYNAETLERLVKTVHTLHSRQTLYKKPILVIYGVYNAETLERLVKTVHTLQSRQTLYKNLFPGRTSVAYEYYSQMHGK